MKNIVYFEPQDTEKFDIERFENSLRQYADIPRDAIEEALKEVEEYEALHVSRLVKIGTNLIDSFGDEAKAREYYEAHKQYFGENFERLRRITGYLVGTLERWNDGKRAEESQRVKHSVNSSVDDLARSEKLQDQMLAYNAAYVGKAE
ncbi:hypothetical protein IKG06_03660 [Candidatus Saccharibacteria bacterium]|nr:hypothetical protein [Candidatus Saccharibacteria bacterium]